MGRLYQPLSYGGSAIFRPSPQRPPVFTPDLQPVKTLSTSPMVTQSTLGNKVVLNTAILRPI